MLSAQDRDWLHDMQSQYLSRADAKLAELALALDSLAAAPSDLARQGRLRHLLHNLAGSGGSFGFQAVSETAEAMLDLLRSARDGERAVDAQFVNDLRSGLDELRKAFEQAGASGRGWRV